MGRYAESTAVSASKSRAEMEKTLARYGADGFMYGWDGNHAVVAFRMNNRHIKFELPMPDRGDFAMTPAGRRRRTADKIESAYEQATRQRWRALALVIKAKLEAVESGITEFDDEFMSHIVMPDGQTVGQHLKPRIESAYSTGKMVKLLPHFGDN